MSKCSKFSAEFKRSAVEQARQLGVSCAQLARELGIGGQPAEPLEVVSP